MGMQLVQITWVDAAHNNSIYDREDIQLFGLLAMKTIGHLIEERDDCYILATELFPDGERWRHMFAIPKSGVVAILSLIPASKLPDKENG